MERIANKYTEIIVAGDILLEVPKPVVFIGCDDEHHISLESKLQFSTIGETFYNEHYQHVINARHTNA